MLTQMNDPFNQTIPSMAAQFINTKEITLKAKAVSNQVKSLVRDGKIQYKYARIAKNLIAKQNCGESPEVLVSIAAWHYERASELFRSAAQALNATSTVDLSRIDKQYIESKKAEFVELSEAMKRKAVEISLVRVKEESIH